MRTPLCDSSLTPSALIGALSTGYQREPMEVTKEHQTPKPCQLFISQTSNFRLIPERRYGYQDTFTRSLAIHRNSYFGSATGMYGHQANIWHCSQDSAKRSASAVRSLRRRDICLLPTRQTTRFRSSPFRFCSFGTATCFRFLAEAPHLSLMMSTVGSQAATNPLLIQFARSLQRC
jgi:hypothetical protein